MLPLIRRHKLFFAVLTLAGLALRLMFVFKFSLTRGDSLIYGEIAVNWLKHGVFGFSTASGSLRPTLIRLPGYPAFLAGCFALFGSEHYNAVRFVQVAVDLFTCFVVADTARRVVSNRAARVAFALAALCPFTANYVALPLTETLAIAAAALALWFGVRALDRPAGMSDWIGCGVSVAAGILLRPDGGILLGCIGVYLGIKLLAKRDRRREIFIGGVLIAVFALAPLGPWAWRNWHTFHVVQPLAPRYANDPDEFSPGGFNRWAKTWIAEYASVVEVYWREGTDTINPNDLPNRAFDSPEQRERTLALIEEYNDQTDVTRALDAQFAALASERVHDSRFRYYGWLPALRIADMWLRPRTEMFSVDERWWEIHRFTRDSEISLAYGALNLAYVALAFYGVLRGRVRYAGLFLTFVVLRSLFLGTLENPEARYTLEMFPALFVFAAEGWERLRKSQEPTESQAN